MLHVERFRAPRVLWGKTRWGVDAMNEAGEHWDDQTLDLPAGQRPEPQRARRVFIETHGCQMNVHDTEKALALLTPLGFVETGDPASADLVLLNTCSVREKASEKVFHRIETLKRTGRPRRVIGVLGCVAQAEAEAIFERVPDVRLVVGPQALESLGTLVAQLDAGFPRAIDVRQDNRPDFVEVGAEMRRAGAVAYVTIIEGCNKNCSYCIVPFTRGRERSRPADRIVAEMRALSERGYREVHLLGQNVNSYSDWVVRPSGRRVEENAFPYLLERVARETPVERIKYTTSHPRDFSRDIVRVMDDHESLCNWIHLPVQSGSDRVLRRMYRGYSREHYFRAIDAIKSAKRDYAITSDIIVGFPGETDAEFDETLDLVRRVAFDGLYTFHYSPRPHTPAEALPDSVPAAVKRERFAALLEVQGDIQRRRYERYLGRSVSVLVGGEAARNPGDVSGHSTCNKVVNFNPGGRRLLGEIVSVRITRVHPHSLYGELV
jgi:tRNA-2-methylthio-N6-dimethylallyladenosine synthase